MSAGLGEYGVRSLLRDQLLQRIHDPRGRLLPREMLDQLQHRPRLGDVDAFRQHLRIDRMGVRRYGEEVLGAGFCQPLDSRLEQRLPAPQIVEGEQPLP